VTPLLLTLCFVVAAKETETFDADPVGGAAKSFAPAIGEWRVAEMGGQHGYLVDGTSWRQGTPSVGLADHAKRL
jgi:hypothetical protein